MRYRPRSYKDARLDRRAQLGYCVSCSASALYCEMCGESVGLDRISNPKLNCLSSDCGHRVAIYGKWCLKHRKERQREKKRLIARSICHRCGLKHPGPACLYRRFRDGGLSTLTEEQLDWVWKEFVDDPDTGRSKENYNILYSREEEQIIRQEKLYPTKTLRCYSKQQIAALGSLADKPFRDYLMEDLKLWHSSDITEGMQRARALGKRIGRPNRSNS